MKMIACALAALGTVVLLAGCVSPVADTGSGADREALTETKAPIAPAAAPVDAVTVSSDAEGLRVAVNAIASGKEGECITMGLDSIMLPSQADLVAADHGAAAGVDAKGRVVGPESRIAAAYGGATPVARTSDGLKVWLLGQVDGRRAVVLARGFKTPGGNVLWLDAGRTYSVPCP